MKATVEELLAKFGSQGLICLLTYQFRFLREENLYFPLFVAARPVWSVELFPHSGKLVFAFVAARPVGASCYFLREVNLYLHLCVAAWNVASYLIEYVFEITAHFR